MESEILCNSFTSKNALVQSFLPLPPHKHPYNLQSTMNICSAALHSALLFCTPLHSAPLRAVPLAGLFSSKKSVDVLMRPRVNFTQIQPIVECNKEKEQERASSSAALLTNFG